MRRVRQRNVRVPDVLVASTRITSPAQFLKSRRVDPLADSEAWRWYDGIGEVHFGIASGGREASRAVLKAVRWEDADTPVDSTDQTGGGQIADFVSAIQSANGGQCQIINSFYLNRKVTGDGYLFGYPSEDDPEYLWFEFLSSDEIKLADESTDTKNGRDIRRMPTPLGVGLGQGSQGYTDYPIDDVILSRIWTPHPRYSGVADSPLKALHTVCDELYILTMSLKAKITSRLATAGFLLFPASVANSTPIPQPSESQERFSENDFVNYVMQTMTQAIIHPSEPSASVPFVLVVPDQAVDLVKWIREEAQTFEVDIRQRAELIGRILSGLDLRPEQIKGFGESNHWSAWSTQDVHLKVDVAPELEALCWALTKDYLWPQIREAAAADELDSRINWDEDEIRHWAVWYDLNNLTVRPNKADSYVTLADHGAINLTALRDATGATDAESPTEEEYVQQLGWMDKNPYLATFGMNIAEKIDWDQAAIFSGKGAPGPAPTATPEAPSGPGKSPPGPKPSQSNKPKSQQPQ